MSRPAPALLALAAATLAAFPASAQTAVSADGRIVSQTGGLRFPDGSTQTTGTAAGLAPVARTGQVFCWDGAGTLVPCPDTGQDGDHQAGVLSSVPRFVNGGDGTVTDRLTGLVWLKDAHCAAISPATWLDAVAAAKGLESGDCGLSDGSAPGDWRLPNVNELAGLLDFGGGPPLLPPAHPFSNVQISYWSSSAIAPGTGSATAVAWVVSNGLGQIGGGLRSDLEPVWPVRGATGDAPAAVADTGLQICVDAFDLPVFCAGTGQDAELRAGVDWPTPRFRDNGDGTVTDALTELVWLREASCAALPAAAWAAALAAVNGLADGSCGLSDSSQPGDWRVPNLRELLSLREWQLLEFPSLASGHPFEMVSGNDYWTSTSDPATPGMAFTTCFLSCGLVAADKSLAKGSWPVRGGTP